MLFYFLGVAMSGKIYRCNPMFFCLKFGWFWWPHWIINVIGWGWLNRNSETQHWNWKVCSDVHRILWQNPAVNPMVFEGVQNPKCWNRACSMLLSFATWFSYSQWWFTSAKFFFRRVLQQSHPLVKIFTTWWHRPSRRNAQSGGTKSARLDQYVSPLMSCIMPHASRSTRSTKFLLKGPPSW